MTRRRTRWRSYLLLARASNLPTVWTNVLAGIVAAGVAVDWATWFPSAAAVSLLYTAGMFLNDAADCEFDARHRADRPIPAGDVPLGTVVIAGALLAAAGLIVLAWQGRGALPWGLALTVAILYYDYRHKHDAFGPLVMGVCRGLVYAVAATAVAGAVSRRVSIAALALTAYVSVLTLAAKQLGPRGRMIVPILIAAISLVDAVVVLACSGSPVLALVTASGFALTLVFQRGIPGD